LNAAAAGTIGKPLTYPDREQAVVDDVRRIRNHPLVPGRIPIHGLIYDCTSGRLVEVPEADAVGASQG